METQPKVTVCIPVFNGEKYLEKTLESLEKQTYPSLEIFILDNCSTDRTRDIAQKYCEKHSHFKVIKNEVNIGAANNFNKGLTIGDGDFLALFHADDIYYPEIISESVKSFKNPEVSIVGSLGDIIDQDDRKSVSNYIFLPGHLKDKPLSFLEVFKAVCHTGNGFLLCPTMVIRRSRIPEIGFFNQKLFKSALDFAYWLEHSRKGKIFINSKKLISYRIHANQGSQWEVRENILIPDSVKVVRHYYQFYEKNLNHYYGYLSYQLMLTLFRRLLRKRYTHRWRLFNLAWKYYFKSPLLYKQEIQTAVCLLGLSLDVLLRGNFVARLSQRSRQP